MRLPSNISSKDPDAGELLSWRVYLLPYIEQQNLFDSFHLDEPWDSPHNKELIPLMPPCYEHALLQSSLPEGHTVFQMPTSQPEDHPSTVLVQGQRGSTFGSISDGTSNTIMLLSVDAQSAVPWTKPADWQFDPSNPRRNFGNDFSGKTLVGTCHGTIEFLSKEVSDEAVRALFTKNGGEAFGQW